MASTNAVIVTNFSQKGVCKFFFQYIGIFKTFGEILKGTNRIAKMNISGHFSGSLNFSGGSFELELLKVQLQHQCWHKCPQ